MKTLVVYDSVYGNTETIAKAIGAAIGDATGGDVQVRRPGQVGADLPDALDLLVVGAPTYGGQPTEAMQGFLDRIPEGSLQGIHVAAFDTRLAARWVRVFGFAGPKIAERLQEKGGTPVGAPEGFIVKGRRGPLKDREEERAAAWAKEIAAGVG